MKIERMLEIAKDIQVRHIMCKTECSSCIDDEVLEYDEDIIKILEMIEEVLYSED